MIALIIHLTRHVFACLVKAAHVVWLLLLLGSSMLVHASDYSDGLKAYLEGDFGQAQIFWLKGAKQNDAKSMFNLGLLHEQNKIANPSADKADNWYRLSGRNGYAAADYHLAKRLLQRGGKRSEVIELMERASEQGFKPAMIYLGRSSRTSVKQVAKPSQQTQKAPASRDRYLSETWIKSKKPAQWTIQMLAFKDKKKVHRFIDEHDLHQRAAFFEDRANGEVLYKLIYGVYDSKNQADFARQNLSSALKQYGPWLRPMSSVHAVIDRR